MFSGYMLQLLQESLALGKNILVAYMPWEGYNFEDAVLVSERLVFDDLFTSVHIERYDISTSRTREGQEYITSKVDKNDLFRCIWCC